MDTNNSTIPNPPQETAPTIETQVPQTNIVNATQSSEIQYAGFGRLPALMVDEFIVLVIGFTIFYFMYYPNEIDLPIAQAIIGLLQLTYSVIFIQICGATPGKLLLKMRVVDGNHTKPNFWRILLRESVGKSISGLLFPISVLLLLFDKQKRSIHDFIAHTYVIYKK